MTNQEKATLYDNCIRESDRLRKEISILKSEYTINPPLEVQEEIKQRQARIFVLEKRVENLFR